MSKEKGRSQEGSRKQPLLTNLTNGSLIALGGPQGKGGQERQERG